MIRADQPAMTTAEAEALLVSIGHRPDWTEAQLITATSRFGPMKFDRVKRAIAFTIPTAIERP